MKRSMIVATLLLAASTALFAQNSSNTPPGLPPPDANAFLHYIQKGNSYQTWHLLPGTTKMHKGTSPVHGALITTYVNSLAYDAITHNQSYPNGSIIVKQNYTPQKKLKVLTTMYKVAGYNPQADNWFWVKALPSGKVKQSGKIKGCISCHSKAKNNDYVFR